jgi:hypothetical protein
MAQPPSAILKKAKKKQADPVRADKQGDDKHDEKMPVKGGKRNSLIDFIAKCKKTAA